ncbi:DUF1330 domain-containing protein [Adhaeribacter arboris]|uniref:DUF1330 domain-containing protein n=1 Tax=Adhaeribacter arboris TaxID=2072846 RepID=A0A2T2YE50_9BACT|nr:DUF1330 domain-containing protein [Adhaeribacter arboris]PSR53781.1 DUF1330 domain-containing protein [Adhaeribacter arboris]
MADSKLYLTLFLYLHEGEEATFLEYEDQVLPMLAKYKGELIYRIRPEITNFVQPSAEYPYEIHLISFSSAQDFENFRQDKERLALFPLFQKSVRKVLLLPSPEV